MSTEPTILVMGASGMVGRQVVALLEKSDRPHRVGVRRPDAFCARPLSDVHLFDWDRPETWGQALGGVDTLFLLKPPGDDPALRIRALLERAPRLEHVVMLSEIHCETRPVDDAQRAAELALEHAAVRATILRPNWFFQNLTEGSYAAALQAHARLDLATGGQRVSYVDTRDVAAVAVTALTTPGDQDRAHLITGPEALSGNEVADAIAQVSGRSIHAADPSLESIRRSMVDSGATAQYIDFIMRLCQDMVEGRNAVTTDTVQQVTGRPARAFADFAAESASCWTLPVGGSR